MNYAILTNLTINTTYSFAIAARNIHGEGIKSTSVTIHTSFAPLKPIPVQVTKVLNKIVISWVPPDSQGSDILSYDVTILNKLTNQYEENTSVCDGSQPAI